MKLSRVTLAILIALMVLLAAPPVVPAQTFYGDMAAGLNVGPVRNESSLTFQASIGGRISQRFETRLEALFLPALNPIDNATCDNSVPWQACNPAISARGLVGSGVLNLTTPARGARLYLIGGVGTYRFHFYGSYNETALGVSGGIGCAVRTGQRLRFVLEARHHYMMDGRYWLRDVVPVVFRFQF
jgi:hypothetical protein